MKRRWISFLCLLCVCALLSGCQSRESVAAAQVTLPPAAVKQNAPNEDAVYAYEQTVMMYLPSLDGTRLVAVPQRVKVPAGEHMARMLCEALLAHPGTENAAALGAGISLSLAEKNAVEVSGQVVTVDLDASALGLSSEQFFTVGQALANTICQFGDVRYVNVLVSGMQPGLNQAGTLPAGCFQMNMREDLTELWTRASTPMSLNRRAYTASLYYPASSGKGILCEARTFAAVSTDTASLTQTLLEALSAEASTLPRVPKCPDFRSQLADTPAVEEQDGRRVLALRFRDTMNAALIDAGITRSVMMASLVYTFTSFLPGISGVAVYIGDERISSLTPSGVYERAGETLTFGDGVMTRRDFAGFLLAECSLYFADENGRLCRVFRPVPCKDAYSARVMYEQLLEGPQAYDSKTGLRPVLPKDLAPDDLLGVSYDGNVLLANFSGNLASAAADMDGEAIEHMIYGLVDTLCCLPGVKRAAIFVEGQQPETLGGTIYLPGDFMPSQNVED
ncbi:MAG: GerMN domain-containing protein [Clostridia bacterium]|nr:GerMN domain-containing protein [Clostridia bacterium]